MMLATMAARSTKTTGTRKPRTEGRRKPEPATSKPKDSLFAKVGEEGRREAQRKLLHKALKDNDWSLKATAEALGMSGSPHVLRAIQDVGLAEEYEKAKERGDITPGRPRG